MSIFTALQTLQHISQATSSFQKQEDNQSSLNIFHFQLTKVLNNIFSNTALLSVKFLGVKPDNIPDDAILKSIILKEIAEVQKQIDFYSLLDNIQAAKTKHALIKVYDVLTKAISY